MTAAYRLNVFGFFSTYDSVAPGNFGLLDQVAALDWVMSKISAFGGSASNVVLCGHGAGGMSIGLHMVSPLSRGKFHKAIAMSPKGIVNRSIKSRDQMEKYKYELADIFACAPESSLLVDCLRRVSGSAILEHAAHLLSNFGPIIDADYVNDSRPFLPKDPEELLLEDEEFVQVPLLVGYAHMEDGLNLLESNGNLDNGMSWDDFNMYISEEVENDILNYNVNDSCILELSSLHLKDTAMFYYTPRPLTNDLTVLREKFVDFLTEKFYGAGAYLLASAVTRAKVDAYVYRFDYKIKTENAIRFSKAGRLPTWITASHQFDLPFIWGMPYWTQIKRNVTWNSADKKMADVMLTLWGNFVKYGNPTHSNINLKWEVFKENTSAIMILDRNSNVSDVLNFDYKAFEFWNNYYPKTWNILLQGCNMTSSAFLSKTPISSAYCYLIYFLLFYVLGYFAKSVILLNLFSF